MTTPRLCLRLPQDLQSRNKFPELMVPRVLGKKARENVCFEVEYIAYSIFVGAWNLTF